MFNWFQRLLPRTGDFFGMFEAHAATLVAAAEALIDYGDPRGLEAVATLLEDRSDQVRHHALLALDKPMQLDKALILKVEPLRADPYEYTKRVAERIVRRQQKASK